ncbi:MAG: DUF1553 domain-containing protein [Acidobacteria bacterium]|nr:DUF1553 domain-containing protein [Acidobacteriota bacterium]
MRLLLFAAIALRAQPVDFAREVRPLLSDRCFACHGPDEANRMAGLRLDVEAEAKTAAIVPGDPGASRILKRINHPNDALRMPPAHLGHKRLTPSEAKLIERWIVQGAKWQTHWAFVRPTTSALSDIDAFVAARLSKEGLRMSVPATRAQLLRRVSFDITGLPPSPAELREFEKTGDYAKAVDRLLASPRYGEKWAVEWLDAARYADTHGYQVDPEKNMWAWRDWVIEAYNKNMPYDRFLTEQLAGDLLPNATLSQKIATGFNRNHRVNTEAGSIAEEFHNENIVDRMSTAGTVFMGLTIGCARCHDHKYDPISNRDFYRFYAFFNNVKEIGTGGPRDGRGNLQPVLKLPDAELEAKAEEARGRVVRQRAVLREVEAKLEKESLAWREPRWEVMKPAQLRSDNGATLSLEPDGSIVSTGKRPDRDIYTLQVNAPSNEITGFRIELMPDARFPQGGSGRGDDGKGVLTLFEVERDGGEKLDLGTVSATGQSPESILDRVVRPMRQLKRGWSVDPDVAVPYYAVVETKTMIAGGRFTIRLGNEFGEGALLGRFRISVTSDEFPEPVKEAEKSKQAFLVSHQKERRDAGDELARLQAEQRQIEQKLPSTMVMAEMETPRDTFILARGAYDKPGEKVTPGVPSFLLPMPEGAKADRLALAKWLTDPAHPLTARVAVNRLWQSLFGMGLVKTSEDFGSQGETPSHPELLDYLALEYIKSGWDTKAMIRRIVMSAAYKQSSKATPALVEKDPENRLLARGPRVRLAAEMIRDQALAVSGLLHEKIGGAPVKPYQPEGLWEQLSVIDDQKLYVQSKGADLYRRSLYTYWKRTVPPPSLTTFDAPTREFCSTRRPLSTTPLQALALLNDETYVEASRKLAERMMLEGGATLAARIRFGFALATSRLPTVSELAVLQVGFERRLAAYRANAGATAKLLEAGESPREPSLNAVELAAYTTVASVLLNLDEVITKQ